MGRIVINQERK